MIMVGSIGQADGSNDDGMLGMIRKARVGGDCGSDFTNLWIVYRDKWTFPNYGIM